MFKFGPTSPLRADLADQPIVGSSPTAPGVRGESNSGVGVSGASYGRGNPPAPASDGVKGVGKNGVHGLSLSATDSGVWGEHVGTAADGGNGVRGTSSKGHGVLGQTFASGTWEGASGNPDSILYSGVFGVGTGQGYGVSGAGMGGGYGVFAISSQNHALFAQTYASGKAAGHFEGDVEVNGNVQVSGDILLANQDCAEDFEVTASERIDPGAVVIINPNGALSLSNTAYDKRVAGVVSGAGNCKPGIVLGRRRVQHNKMPVALVGKVYCKVDAGYSPIELGDLLTSSETPGHAMRASDQARAFGAVIGKALGSLQEGRGLIPVLVALQ